MGKYTKEDILRIAEEEDVEFIRLQFTDIFGILKNVTIARSQLAKALDNNIMMDGSSIEGFTRIHESDQYLHPDYDSFVILPWCPQEHKVARMICDVFNPDGTPFEGDPRYVLKRALARAEAMGYTFMAGPEMEFFLFETDEKGRPTTNSGDEAGYFDMAPIDRGGEVRRDVCLALEALGFEIEASHHECAAGQHEIDFKYADALKAADNIMTFKMAVKTIAQQKGLHATFMPKPLYGVAGSGMHTNMSLFKDGKNIFYAPGGVRELSSECYEYIAGLLKHVRAMTSVTNPLVNSYKRLVPGYEAPCYLAWSASNRSALVRIPASRGQSTRVELRCPDPCCNPYLAMAVCLAAGLDGIENKLTPPAEITENIYAMGPEERRAHGIDSLPGTLLDAVRCTEADSLILDTLGSHVTASLLSGQKAEWYDYRSRVTNWELNKYMVIY